MKASEFKKWIREDRKDRGGKIPIFDLPKRPTPPKAIIVTGKKVSVKKAVAKK